MTEPKNKIYVKEIWRFSAKSIAGEMLDAAHLDENGIAGDNVERFTGKDCVANRAR